MEPTWPALTMVSVLYWVPTMVLLVTVKLPLSSSVVEKPEPMKMPPPTVAM